MAPMVAMKIPPRSNDSTFPRPMKLPRKPPTIAPTMPMRIVTKITWVVAQHHGLPDVGCQRSVYVAQSLKSNSIRVNLSRRRYSQQQEVELLERLGHSRQKSSAPANTGAFDKRSWLREQPRRATGRPRGELAKVGSAEARFGERTRKTKPTRTFPILGTTTQNSDQKITQDNSQSHKIKLVLA